MLGFAARSVLYLAIAYGAAVAALYVFQGGLLFPSPNVSAMEADGRFERIDLTTDDGETLRALFLPGDANLPTVIVFHGNASAPVFEQGRAFALGQAGYPVLLATWRGYGGSTGSPSAHGLKLDAMAAHDWVNANSDTPPILYAQSLGTGPAVHVAARRDVTALVLEAPYDELAAVAASHYPWVPVRPLFRHNIAPIGEIAQIDVRVLMIHGARDTVIPIRHGRALADAGGDTVEFVVIEDAGHNNLAARGALDRALLFLDDVTGE